MEQKLPEDKNDVEEWGTQRETSQIEMEVNVGRLNVGRLEQLLHKIQTAEMKKEQKEEQRRQDEEKQSDDEEQRKQQWFEQEEIRKNVRIQFREIKVL